MQYKNYFKKKLYEMVVNPSSPPFEPVLPPDLQPIFNPPRPLTYPRPDMPRPQPRPKNRMLSAPPAPNFPKPKPGPGPNPPIRPNPNPPIRPKQPRPGPRPA
jgi:hypothetical protein